MIRSRLLFLIGVLSFFSGVSYSANYNFVLVIDAGHGGKDTGATRKGYKEKDINLGVALTLGRLIQDNFKDVKVVYTRKSDVFVDLDRRSEIANKAKANLFISIHTNSTSATSTSASGADTYILGLARSSENLEVAKRENSVIQLEDDYKKKYEGFDPNSPESYIIFEFMTNKYMEQSLQFASFVQKDFKDVAHRTDRGIRQAGFLVLRKTGSPSVLIELGFINSPIDAKFLSSSLGQQAMATAIYSGFKKYKRNFDKMQKGLYSSASSYKADDDDLTDDVVADPGDISISNTSSFDDTLAKKNTDIGSKSNSKKVVVPQPTVVKGNEKERASNQQISKKGVVEYRVQFLYSATKLPNNSSLFKGLSPVDFYKDGSNFKYTYGSTTDINEIIRIQQQVRKLFKDAFVIKFKDGERLK